MSHSSVVVSLPIADRRNSFAFFARPGHSECVLSLGTASDADVDELVKRAQDAGAEVLTEPRQQPWGCAGTFTDPDGHVWMVASESPHG
jgi:uncharacterized glyoxalase superfamily protein PhnB